MMLDGNLSFIVANHDKSHACGVIDVLNVIPLSFIFQLMQDSLNLREIMLNYPLMGFGE